MQLHTRGKDMGKQKVSFMLKLRTKNRGRQNGGKRQSSNQKPQAKYKPKPMQNAKLRVQKHIP